MRQQSNMHVNLSGFSKELLGHQWSIPLKLCLIATSTTDPADEDGDHLSDREEALRPESESMDCSWFRTSTRSTTRN